MRPGYAGPGPGVCVNIGAANSMKACRLVLHGPRQSGGRAALQVDERLVVCRFRHVVDAGQLTVPSVDGVTSHLLLGPTLEFQVSSLGVVVLVRGLPNRDLPRPIGHGQ